MPNTKNSDSDIVIDFEIDEGVITSAYGPEEAEEEIDQLLGTSPLEDSEE